MSLFDNYHFDIDHGICVFCAEESNCYEHIVNKLKEEYPGLDIKLSETECGLLIEIPSSFYKRRYELLTEYITRCLVFESYDYTNIREPICKKHLQEVILSRL